MRLYLLATFVAMSVVYADSESSFLIEASSVDEPLLPDRCEHLLADVPGAYCQDGKIIYSDPSKVVKKQELVSTTAADVVKEIAETKESWWSYGKRLASGAMDVAYQYLRANRVNGPESGSCQSWTSLTTLPELKGNWGVNSKQNLLVEKDGKSVISMRVCDDLLSEGYEGLGLMGAIEKADKIQKQTKVKNVYLPLNLNLTNYVSCIVLRWKLFTMTRVLYLRLEY